MCMSRRQPASSMTPPRQASLLARDSAAPIPGLPSRFPPQWKLNFNLEHSVWMQTFQKVFGLDQIELLVARLHAEKETVFRCERKSCDVEYRVVRSRQAVHRQHAENC